MCDFVLSIVLEQIKCILIIRYEGNVLRIEIVYHWYILFECRASPRVIWFKQGILSQNFGLEKDFKIV